MTLVPLVLELPGSFRHSSPWVDRLRMNSPLVVWNHFSFEPPVQDHRITLVPLPPLPWSLAHLPLCFSSPLENVQPWAESELLHDQRRTGVPFAELLPLASRHMLPNPLSVRTGPEELPIGAVV